MQSDDIKNFIVFFKIKEEQFNANLKEFEQKIDVCLSVFDDFNIKKENIKIINLLPDHLLIDFLDAREDYEKEILKYCENFSIFQEFVQFYEKNKENFHVIKKLNNKFEFGNVDLLFAENFRFKAKPDSFNLFHLRKELRDIVKVPSKDYFLFACDYKQFEFRTLLKLLNYDFQIFSENLYEYIGKKINLSPEESKLAIISWMYSNKENVVLDRELDRGRLLSTVRDGASTIDAVPVFVGFDGAKNKIIHSIVQTHSQFFYLDKLKKIMDRLEGKKSQFVFPLHDSMIFFIHKDEINLMEEIPEIMENEIYKVKCFIGKNYKEIEEI